MPTDVSLRMKPRFVSYCCLLLAELIELAAARPGRGARHPNVIQDRAPEILEVRVERITRSMLSGEVLFRARVLAVRRSVAGVSAGDLILVRYRWVPADIRRRELEWDSRLHPPGPQFFYEPDPPAAGATILAHLAAVAALGGANGLRAFVPGAYQCSFEPLP